MGTPLSSVAAAATALLVGIGCGGNAAAYETPDATGDAPQLAIVCGDTHGGAYCGGKQVRNGDPSVLYECPAPDAPPTAEMACPEGCVVEPPGMEDRCKVPATVNGYRLPWEPETTMRLSQDCDDSCCSDHVGDDKFAYDWANGGGFPIIAARGGTITHLKINSMKGCAQSTCSGDANYIVIDHGDGTQSTYFHLAGHTLAPGIACGAPVAQGAALATSGTTGHSTGIHLHFQVSKVHPTAAKCECGADGTQCAANVVPYAAFWATPTYPTVPVTFDDWPTSAACANRRIVMPTSQNQ
jgi:hypothetical protein